MVKTKIFTNFTPFITALGAEIFNSSRVAELNARAVLNSCRMESALDLRSFLSFCIL